ncbi:putative pectate lyase E [Leptodontidium sp. MPI-SDFR-AT-0119]|nr:putative pectate lyase E [Leptodontidium sp. MPI-SDFR-AT-0119]
MQLQTVVLAGICATLSSAQTLNISTRVGSIISLSSPSSISGSIDLGNREYDRRRDCNTDDDTSSANAVFVLENVATLSNVIIGVRQLEGVHCKAACTLKNVWFRDVCHLLLGTGDVLIQGGGAANTQDKVVQHNGKGTITIKDFTAVSVGMVYRSCGNCSDNGGPRKVIISGLKANGVTADVLGINSNYGDTATVSGSCGQGIKNVCQQWTGVDKKLASAGSTKLASKDSCFGAQGKLTTLPACWITGDWISLDTSRWMEIIT